jgi:hypothetical protein
MKAIVITTVNNGYVVHDAADMHMGVSSTSKTRVFSTFEALTAWMKTGLDSPEAAEPSTINAQPSTTTYEPSTT